MKKDITWIKSKDEVIEKMEELGLNKKVKYRKAKSSHNRAKKIAQNNLNKYNDYEDYYDGDN